MRDKPIRDCAIRGAGAIGMHTVRRTAYDDLQGLIRSLRPIDSGIELIRLGPDGDGGYLIPDDLDGIEYAFSPGVSTESGFEAALAARGMRVHLADFSVAQPPQQNEAFVFDRKFVGCLTNETFMTMDDWKRMRIGDYGGDLLLQMDIEGAEFETLMATSERLLSQFRIMVIEFHYLHQLWNKPWFILVARAIEKILQTHKVVHIHPNNHCGSFKSRGLRIPRVAEFTFLRKDRLRQETYAQTFPHPLDRDNTPKPSLPLPECWYR